MTKLCNLVNSFVVVKNFKIENRHGNAIDRMVTKSFIEIERISELIKTHTHVF